MIDWLRIRLKQWLDDPQPMVMSLDCIIDGRVVRMAVDRAVGMKLQVYDGRNSFLIGVGKALDPVMFWKAWEPRSEGKYTWPDGTEFKPAETSK